MNKHRTPQSILATVAMLIVLTCVAPTTGHASRAQRIAEKQKKKLVANDALLHAAEWEQADENAQQMMNSIGVALGCSSPALLGAAIFQHVIALAGLGHVEQARWYAELSHSLYPELPPSLAASYGDPGRAVAPALQDEDPEAFGGHTIYSLDVPKPEAEGLKPPKKIAGPMPMYNREARRQGLTGPVGIRLIVDTHGLPHRPRIDCQFPISALTWLTLDALRQWRFQPATREGVPVPVDYHQFTTFSLN